jgi:hypothetical protein
MDNKTFNSLEKRLARLEKAVFGQQGKTKGSGKSKATTKTSDFSGPRVHTTVRSHLRYDLAERGSGKMATQL